MVGNGLSIVRTARTRQADGSGFIIQERTEIYKEFRDDGWPDQDRSFINN
jgi:hypothetical protein